MRRKERRFTSTIRIAAVLFVLVIVSLYLLSGMYGRYATGAESNDMARVASWSPDASIGSGGLTVTADGSYNTQKIEFTVTGSEEVASEYSVMLKLFRNDSEISWPDGAEAKITSSSGELLGTSSDGIFEDLGTLDPGEKKSLYIFFKADYNVTGGPYTMEISVRLEQLD